MIYYFIKLSNMKFICLVLLCSITALTAQSSAPLTIGTEVPVNHDTGTPYNPNDQTGVVFQQTFYNKKSMYIKLYFEDFDLAAGDYVEISTHNTGASILYAGKGKIIDSDGRTISDFWSQVLFDEEVTVRLYSRDKSGHRGFLISRVAYGFSEAEIDALANAKSICGGNDYENVWCYNGNIEYTRSRAVCRLIIGGSGSCTGWLLGANGHVVTNNHCISNNAEANNTDFVFDFEKRVCSGSSLRSGSVAANSSSIVSTSTTLDYTLLDLPNNPSTTYGYLQLSPSAPRIGDPIYIVGHPSGKRKRISLRSDLDPNNLAVINNVTATRVEYFADTRPGSSGSPVLSRDNDWVLSLHNTGGCPNGSSASSTQLINHIGNNMPILGVANTITNLSYNESFESVSTNGEGWFNRSDDDFDWTRRSNATPSNGTGPNSAANGSFYYHIEASNPNNPSKTAELYSPWFTMTNSYPGAVINFDYHMWGVAMGTLRLQVSTDGGASWFSLWTRSGDQGNLWFSATVDISNYINIDGLQFRFQGRTGSGFEGDMAIDDIRISSYTPPPCNSFYPTFSHFEAGLDNWTQSINDDFNWSLGSGAPLLLIRDQLRPFRAVDTSTPKHQATQIKLLLLLVLVMI
jgi:V8-like Glu-specific endopeptidase